MDQFIVPQVKAPVNGEVEISGAKNAVLAVMAAALLAEGVSEITNVPHLKDMKTMSDVLRVIGCHINGGSHVLKIDTRGVDHLEAPYELVKTMRASFYVLGPLVARFGRCRVSLPGGCAWGPRPVDLHLKGLEALGAKITVTHGYVEATCEGRLPGGNFNFPISSVGATVNVLMAATLAKGVSVLQNAALEPEIDNLIDFLTSMGAKIQGRGTRTLTVQGVESLRPGTGVTIPDRIEAGTFLRLGRSRCPPAGTQADEPCDAPVPGIPDRYAGTVHGNAPLHSRQQPRARHGLQRSLQACRRTRTLGRFHPDERQHGHHQGRPPARRR